MGIATTNTNWLGVLSGRYHNGLVTQGSIGYWWSSTASNATQAYSLYLDNNTYVGPAFNFDKLRGYAVRCVL